MMARAQRLWDRVWRRLCFYGLLLSATLFSQAVSADFRLLYLQAPVLPPQVPSDGADSPSETLEFVCWLIRRFL